MGINIYSDDLLKEKYLEHKRCAMKVLNYDQWLALYNKNKVKPVEEKVSVSQKKRRIPHFEKISMKYGMGRSTFYNMKKKSKEKYNMIFSYDKSSPEKSVVLFLKDKKAIAKKLDYILDNTKLSKHGFSVVASSLLKKNTKKVPPIWWNLKKQVRDIDDKGILMLNFSTFHEWDTILTYFSDETMLSNNESN